MLSVASPPPEKQRLTHSQQRKHSRGAEVGRLRRPQALREVSDNPDSCLEHVVVFVSVGR